MDQPRHDGRAVSPVVSVALLVAIVVLLAMIVGTMAFGFTDQLDSTGEMYVEDQCPGFQVVEYDAKDFREFADEVTENSCALWLQTDEVETDANGNVTAWRDSGPREFDATQSDEDARPELVTDAEMGEVLSFDATHADDASDRDDNDGQFLNLKRDVDDMDLDEDTGMVVAAVVKVDTFDRGGAWTIGEAGEAGREFSMRTCSDRDTDGCEHADPEGEWRGQHWERADVDFSSGSNSSGEWISLIHAYDGDEVTIRVNGEEVANKEVDLNLSNDRDIQIGRWERTEGDPHWYFDGRIAELMFFDQSLEEDDLDLVEQYFADELGVAMDGPIDA